ncbi:MAG TPA: hypothetical protein VFL03_12170 [Candidatus Limnocylindrales bacterium]|nr:hypothetical protein [Candidatus Limnocylindrales bacterium]
MPIAARPRPATPGRFAPVARVLAASLLAVASVLTAFPAASPAPAAALEPPRPLPGYKARFVTQTDQRPFIDCLWASGAMLLDKWTNGDREITHQRLRALSGDTHGGSQFRDMRVAFRKLGFSFKYSPDGGDPMTWNQLLTRLSKGAGAIVLGDYHKLPRYFGRWDHAFWKKKGKKDNHAMYIERYDRKRGRVWLMDPLARDAWQGEWISVYALRRFVWTRGGAVAAATTPTAKAAPFAKVKASSTPKVVRSGDAVEAAWSLKAPKAWRFPGADVSAKFVPAEDPIVAAAGSPDVPVRNGEASAPRKVSVVVRGKTMRLTAPLPTAAGAYELHMNVRDRRFGNAFVTSGNTAVFIPGDRRASLRLNVRAQAVEAGSPIKLSVNAANTGTETWAGEWTLDAGAGKMTVERGTRLVASWVRLSENGTPDADQDGTPTQVALGAVPLKPGEMQTVKDTLLAPGTVGRWALVVDVVDDVDGSYAALGSEPAVARLDVVAARARGPVE